MKVYIAGPMTGIPQFNYPAFFQMARDLRKVVISPGVHIEVMCPPEMDPPAVQEWSMASEDGAMTGNPYTHGMFLGKGVQRIVDGGFDAIVVLPGWEKSKGARIEIMAGIVSGCKISKPDYLWGGRVVLYEMPRGELLRGLEGDA